MASSTLVLVIRPLYEKAERCGWKSEVDPDSNTLVIHFTVPINGTPEPVAIVGSVRVGESVRGAEGTPFVAFSSTRSFLPLQYDAPTVLQLMDMALRRNSARSHGFWTIIDRKAGPALRFESRLGVDDAISDDVVAFRLAVTAVIDEITRSREVMLGEK